jgi:hypothetical protein
LLPTLTDLQLNVIKYAGGIIAAIYGFIATLTDFHEKKHGKTVLTNAGRYGLIILSVSSIVSLSSDALMDRREDKQKRDEAIADADQRLNTAKYEKETADQLANLLNEAERNLDPLTHDLAVRFRLVIPTNQIPVQVFIKRLMATHPAPNGAGNFLVDATNRPPFPDFPGWGKKGQDDAVQPFRMLASFGKIHLDFKKRRSRRTG